MNLWLDDERPAPEGWTWVKDPIDAIGYLERGDVERMSLDHDLGEHIPSGYWLVRWCAENSCWSRKKPTVHSMNLPGKAAMVALIERYWEGGR